MARKPMTEAQKKARAAKAKATRERKQAEALKALGLDNERKKVRRKRKPMTDEQRAAAAERLAKARAKRGPSKNLAYAETVRLLEEDHPLGLKKTKEALSQCQDELKTMKAFKTSSDWKERSAYADLETYIYNLKTYLRTGVYNDFRYGANRGNRIKQKVVAMAYYKDGTPKRTVGCIYPDIGEYTQEMAINDGNQISNKKQIRKTSRRSRKVA